MYLGMHAKSRFAYIRPVQSFGCRIDISAGVTYVRACSDAHMLCATGGSIAGDTTSLYIHRFFTKSKGVCCVHSIRTPPQGRCQEAIPCHRPGGWQARGITTWGSIVSPIHNSADSVESARPLDRSGGYYLSRCLSSLVWCGVVLCSVFTCRS